MAAGVRRAAGQGASSDGSSPSESRLRKNRQLSKRSNLVVGENSLTFTLTASHDIGVSPLTADEFFDQAEKAWSLTVDGKTITINIEIIGVENALSRFKADLNLQLCRPSVCTTGLGAAEVAGRRIYFDARQLFDTPTHEFGHILGFMDNVAGGTGSIMGPGRFNPPAIRSVTPNDFNSIYNLYSTGR